jgi:hypothetical protein
VKKWQKKNGKRMKKRKTSGTRKNGKRMKKNSKK